MSGGNIVVELLPIGTIVDYETQEAVGAGLIAADYSVFSVNQEVGGF